MRLEKYKEFKVTETTEDFTEKTKVRKHFAQLYLEGHTDFETAMAFCHAPSYKNINDEFNRHFLRVKRTHKKVTIGRVERSEYLEHMTTDFRKQVENDELKKGYEKNPQAFQVFVKTFGTHHIVGAELGGFFLRETRYGMSDDSQHKVSSRHVCYGSNRIERYCGDVDFKEFIKFVTAKPKMVKIDIEPVEDVLKREGFHRKIHLGVEIASCRTLALSFLSDLHARLAHLRDQQLYQDHYWYQFLTCKFKEIARKRETLQRNTHAIQHASMCHHIERMAPSLNLFMSRFSKS